MSVTTLRDPFQCQLEEATPNSFPWQVAIIKELAFLIAILSKLTRLGFLNFSL
jgi:hypothetical protein